MKRVDGNEIQQTLPPSLQAIDVAVTWYTSLTTGPPGPIHYMLAYVHACSTCCLYIVGNVDP